jgi:transposase
LTERKNRRYTADQKLEIVMEVLRGGRSIREVCREHHISESLFRIWRDQVLDGAKARLAGDRGTTENAETRKHIAELERTLGKTALELEIAKKALRDWE